MVCYTPFLAIKAKYFMAIYRLDGHKRLFIGYAYSINAGAEGPNYFLF